MTNRTGYLLKTDSDPCSHFNSFSDPVFLETPLQFAPSTINETVAKTCPLGAVMCKNGTVEWLLLANVAKDRICNCPSVLNGYSISTYKYAFSFCLIIFQHYYY